MNERIHHHHRLTEVERKEDREGEGLLSMFCLSPFTFPPFPFVPLLVLSI